MDDQTAADTSGLSKDKVHTGAATFLFIDAIESYGVNVSYGQLMQHMLVKIKEFNKKAHGGSSGMGALLGGGAMQGALLGGLLGGMDGLLVGGLIGGGMSAMSTSKIGGQTPQLSCNHRADLNAPLAI